MLSQTDAIATVAVSNLDAARKFYEDKLGLAPGPSEEKMVLSYRTGNSLLLVYQSEFAGTNQATCVTWAVDDVGDTVRELQNKGVTFERYDFPGISYEGDVHVMGKRKNAWCKDPDGNILSIVNRD